ncbi:MAG: TolC family protein [Kofleriaceae bacterium]|nr:TolC family protein [Kofleriaceae bacterium]
MPQELIENRPDIRQAELELEAAKLDVKSAKAAFYPSLAVEAGLGYHTYNPIYLLATPASLVFGLAGRFTAPVFNRAAITAQYRTANARQMQAVLVFERTVLQAFTDVATQLTVSEKLHDGYELQAKQVAALAQASDISLVLFQSARADYGEVLLTRRESLEAEMELIETRKKQLLAMVNLYQALGGGWRRT